MSSNQFSVDEAAIYKAWEESGLFKAKADSSADPYVIIMPPPNVTGSLHLGHALTMTLPDVLLRWQRMRGKNVLWQPGLDHAGIATQMIVEREIAKEGLRKEDLGREGFLERVWAWKESSGGRILEQLKLLGASADWDRTLFTMDDQSSIAVREAFVRLYEDGKIYRDARLVNWDPVFQSAISDLEVNNLEVNGSFWHINYPVEGEEGTYITVATTRPETLLGDMAVAVHPDDPKYKDLVGKNVILPLVGRAIPIVADTYTDMEKGTGAVKITPAHDFNDFEVGKRHNLAMPSILNAMAEVTLEEIRTALTVVDGVADPQFTESLEGLDRFDARKKIVAELERLGLLHKVEKHVQQVPHADRGGAVIEPRLTTQWFCDVSEMAKISIDSVKSKDLDFVQSEWENTYFSWLNDIQPWCISRQLWWGHQIPAWYGPDEKMFVARSLEEAQAQATDHYGKAVELTQDNDVLDTWFSSGLWPISTQGWPNETVDMKNFYPNAVLVTGFDIIFFWVARMSMMCHYLTGQKPFDKVFMHGLVRDEKGEKMSKTKGNVIDPVDLIEKYSSDALRWTLCREMSTGRDILLGESHVDLGSRFITKLRNAVGFFEYNGLSSEDQNYDVTKIKTPLCRWIMAKTNTLIEEANEALESFRFDTYTAAIYHFVWDDFCDWYIEMSKPLMADEQHKEEVLAVASYVLKTVLKIIHPAIPFTTETLWANLGYGELASLAHETWPETIVVDGANEGRMETEWAQEVITSIRSTRDSWNVPASSKVPVNISSEMIDIAARLPFWQEILSRLARVSTLSAGANDANFKSSIQNVLKDTTIKLELSDVVDMQAECARLSKQKKELEGNMFGLEKRLSNESYLAKAPADAVEKTRSQLAECQVKIQRIDAILQEMM